MAIDSMFSGRMLISCGQTSLLHRVLLLAVYCKRALILKMIAPCTEELRSGHATLGSNSERRRKMMKVASCCCVLNIKAKAVKG